MSAFHHSPAPFCNSLPCTGAFSTYFYNYMHKGAPMAKLKTKKPCESVKFASLLTGNYVEIAPELDMQVHDVDKARLSSVVGRRTP